MNKRHIQTFALCALAFWAAGLAQAQEAVVSAPKIIKSLSKDIVLDSAGASHSPAVAIDLQVQFAFNSAELLPPGQRQLDELAQALNSKDLVGWGFTLAGHTDRVGSADYNLKLSLERAMAVKNYLVINRGLNPNRLEPVGLGFSQPANPADPSAAINRRVEVRKVSLQARSASVATPMAPARTGGTLVPTP